MAIKVVLVDSAQLRAGVDFPPLENVIDHYSGNYRNRELLP